MRSSCLPVRWLGLASLLLACGGGDSATIPPINDGPGPGVTGGTGGANGVSGTSGQAGASAASAGTSSGAAGTEAGASGQAGSGGSDPLSAGGTSAGGTDAGGSSAGGTDAGGSSAGGSPAGGANVGGSSAGGSSAGGANPGGAAGADAGGMSAGGNGGSPSAGGMSAGGAAAQAGSAGAGGAGETCPAPAQVQACPLPCGLGQRTCQGDGTWSLCTNVAPPGLELCDGLDNDCDGQIDEGLTEDCSNTCGAGTRSCEAGAWSACSAQEPTIETCDGLDNDCDGNIDNGLYKTCSDCDLGFQVCEAGQWSSCQENIVPDSFQLVGTLRDFHASGYVGGFGHPDFESANATDKTIVADLIGPDSLPVYKPLEGQKTPTTNGKSWFDMWYRDTPDYNLSKPFPITLVRKAGVSPPTYVYDDSSFFPLDGQLFGNEGRPHNFHFTYELHSRFFYRGGEHFYFRGDDDLYVFINGSLVINLGGVHGPEGQDVDIDQLATQMGLQKCTPYKIDLFFAERHTSGSNFRIETSLILLDPTNGS